jgi:hypothetical protein
MQNNRSDPPAVPGDSKLTEQILLKETDLQRCIESLQCIICDLLIENEKLRRHLVAEQTSSIQDIGAENATPFANRKLKISVVAKRPARS